MKSNTTTIIMNNKKNEQFNVKKFFEKWKKELEGLNESQNDIKEAWANLKYCFDLFIKQIGNNEKELEQAKTLCIDIGKDMKRLEDNYRLASSDTIELTKKYTKQMLDKFKEKIPGVLKQIREEIANDTKNIEFESKRTTEITEKLLSEMEKIFNTFNKEKAEKDYKSWAKFYTLLIDIRSLLQEHGKLTQHNAIIAKYKDFIETLKEIDKNAATNIDNELNKSLTPEEKALFAVYDKKNEAKQVLNKLTKLNTYLYDHRRENNLAFATKTLLTQFDNLEKELKNKNNHEKINQSLENIWETINKTKTKEKYDNPEQKTKQAKDKIYSIKEEYEEKDVGTLNDLYETINFLYYHVPALNLDMDGANFVQVCNAINQSINNNPIDDILKKTNIKWLKNYIGQAEDKTIEKAITELKDKIKEKINKTNAQAILTAIIGLEKHDNAKNVDFEQLFRLQKNIADIKDQVSGDIQNSECAKLCKDMHDAIEEIEKIIKAHNDVATIQANIKRQLEGFDKQIKQLWKKVIDHKKLDNKYCEYAEEEEEAEKTIGEIYINSENKDNKDKLAIINKHAHFPSFNILDGIIFPPIKNHYKITNEMTELLDFLGRIEEIIKDSTKYNEISAQLYIEILSFMKEKLTTKTFTITALNDKLKELYSKYALEIAQHYSIYAKKVLETTANERIEDIKRIEENTEINTQINKEKKSRSSISLILLTILKQIDIEDDINVKNENLLRFIKTCETIAEDMARYKDQKNIDQQVYEKLYNRCCHNIKISDIKLKDSYLNNIQLETFVEWLIHNPQEIAHFNSNGSNDFIIKKNNKSKQAEKQTTINKKNIVISIADIFMSIQKKPEDDLKDKNQPTPKQMLQIINGEEEEGKNNGGLKNSINSQNNDIQNDEQKENDFTKIVKEQNKKQQKDGKENTKQEQQHKTSITYINGTFGPQICEQQEKQNKQKNEQDKQSIKEDEKYANLIQEELNKNKKGQENKKDNQVNKTIIKIKKTHNNEDEKEPGNQNIKKDNKNIENNIICAQQQTNKKESEIKLSYSACFDPYKDDLSFIFDALSALRYIWEAQNGLLSQQNVENFAKNLIDNMTEQTNKISKKILEGEKERANFTAYVSDKSDNIKKILNDPQIKKSKILDQKSQISQHLNAVTEYIFNIIKTKFHRKFDRYNHRWIRIREKARLEKYLYRSISKVLDCFEQKIKNVRMPEDPVAFFKTIIGQINTDLSKEKGKCLLSVSRGLFGCCDTPEVLDGKFDRYFKSIKNNLVITSLNQQQPNNQIS